MMVIENKKAEYKTNSHFVFCCNYHIIFCPKYRRSVLLEDIPKRLNEIFFEICEKINCRIIEIEILPDHVHMILECDPSFGVSRAISRLKGTSSRILKKEFPSLTKRLPCLWTRTSFVSTVGSVSLDIVKKYINDQKGK